MKTNLDPPEKTDQERYEEDPEELISELREEFFNGDTGSAIERIEDLGLTIDDLDL